MKKLIKISIVFIFLFLFCTGFFFSYSRKYYNESVGSSSISFVDDFTDHNHGTDLTVALHVYDPANYAKVPWKDALGVFITLDPM